MENKEAIKYLILPVATSTKPSSEYLKQKEAYELAIKALQNERPKGEWVDGKWQSAMECNNCGCPCQQYVKHFCANCGADMRGNKV